MTSETEDRALFALVVTTIAGPTESMVAHSREATDNHVNIVVAGDQKGPKRYDLPQTDFLSLEKQREFSPLGRELPTASYTRKNVAYLWAIAHGARVIVETDDDNAPQDGFYRERTRDVVGAHVDSPGWFNVYGLFSDRAIWPRGLPLESLFESRPKTAYGDLPQKSVAAPIQQGLADGDPDVDAVYRMTQPLPLTFETGRTVGLAPGTWSPFNSQNTTWFPEAFPLLYLPSHCSFRMTDIWRSFVAQRIAWANGWSIVFFSPDVFQDRNEHDLLADFRDEVPGYLNNSRIADALESLELASGDIDGSIVACYETLIEIGVVGAGELDLLGLWLQEVSSYMRTVVDTR